MRTERDSFMFYETFKEGIDEVRRQIGEEAAENLALDIIYYGIDGERIFKKADVSLLHNALMISYQQSIDKSKEHKARAIKESEKLEWYRINGKKKKSPFSNIKNQR